MLQLVRRNSYIEVPIESAHNQVRVVEFMQIRCVRARVHFKVSSLRNWSATKVSLYGAGINWRLHVGLGGQTWAGLRAEPSEESSLENNNK